MERDGKLEAAQAVRDLSIDQGNTRHSAVSRWKGERELGERARVCCWVRDGQVGRLGERMAGRTEGSDEGNRGYRGY